MTSQQTNLAGCTRLLGSVLAAATSAALATAWHWPASVFMWVMAFAIYAGFKWLTYREALVQGLAAPARTRVIYLLCWPGMSLKEFAGASPARGPGRSVTRWLAPSAKTLVGAGLVWFAVPALSADVWLLRGWTGMIGLIMTVPARGGYGLPTAYFALQAVGLFVERAPLIRRRPWLTRLFAWLVLLTPLGCLFPPVFVRNVMLPMLQAIGATGNIP